MPSWAKTGLTVRLLLRYLLRLERGLAPLVLPQLSIWWLLAVGVVVLLAEGLVDLELAQDLPLLPELHTPLPLVAEVLVKIPVALLEEPMVMIQYYLLLHLPEVVEVEHRILI
jgi:hypothetical protein